MICLISQQVHHAQIGLNKLPVQILGAAKPPPVLVSLYTYNVSLTILIGQNSVAEWLIVASTYLELKPEIASLLSPPVLLCFSSDVYMKCV
jgi:hypothetical protein